MRRSISRSLVLICLASSTSTMLGVTGCRLSAGSSAGTVTPTGRPGGEGPAPRGQHEDDSVDALRTRLRNLTRDRKSMVAPAAADTGACEDLCSLATQICEVQVKLCKVADRYPQEDDYQNLCREAQQECRAAQESCIDCVGKHQSGPAVE